MADSALLRGLTTAAFSAAGVVLLYVITQRAAQQQAGRSRPSSSGTGASTSAAAPASSVAQAPSPPAESPRDAGVLSARKAEGEQPWRITEGEKEFNLGTYREISSDGHRIEKLLLLEVPHLRALAPADDAKVRNLRYEGGYATAADAHDCGQEKPYIAYVTDSSVIVADIVRKDKQMSLSRAFLRAGPRAELYFNPREVKAAIVTCGGLCPGLNNVIRELVETLVTAYGVTTIYGVQHGYWGFHTPDADPGNASPNCPKREPPLLTLDSVASIHNYGGTVLGSDRGGDAPDVALRFMRNRGVNQLYVIGGDGSHRGAHGIFRRAQELGMPVSIAAIPKTIDNDVDIIDRSFGFDTSFAEAQKAIKTAKTEAACAHHGIGVVKLMGRYAGFISAFATLASGDVDLCLIPEVPVVLDGPCSILTHLQRVLSSKGHAVVVVAEGAGEELLAAHTADAARDAGGNRKLPPIGPWLCDRIRAHFDALGVKTSMKYIDPSYMIRSVAANSADAVYCALLGQNAVHGAMAGYTGFSTGLVNNRMVYLPITAITANSPRRMNPRGHTYERILAMTRQPDPLADPAVAAAWAKASAPKSSE